MTGNLGSSRLRQQAAADIAAAYAGCRGRVLELEGIPMFLALVDERAGRHLVVTDPIAREEGARLADLFDHYDRGVAVLPAELTRVQIEPDTPLDADGVPLDLTGAGPLIDVLVVLSDQHLHARREDTP